jgi:predicted ATPase
MEALSAQVEALSRQKPVLMILEDAHWADPTSLEAFSRAVEQIRTLGVLLVMTYRPEFEPVDRTASCDGTHPQPARRA